MATIQLRTQVPGPRSLALWERRKAAVARGLTTLHPVFLERGEGAVVTDVDGNRLLDFTGGIGALNVGHARPEIAKAISEQAARLTHTAIQVAGYEPYVALAEKLCAIAPVAGPKKAFLVTTGTEAVENAVKLSRAKTGAAPWSASSTPSTAARWARCRSPLARALTSSAWVPSFPRCTGSPIQPSTDGVRHPRPRWSRRASASGNSSAPWSRRSRWPA